MLSPHLFNTSTNMENNDELLIRRKRVDVNGEWEYECVSCERWLVKTRFRGCIEFIDAYGNCLMCSSCRASKGQALQKQNIRTQVDMLLNNLGYDLLSGVPIHIQFLNKHNLPIKNRDL